MSWNGYIPLIIEQRRNARHTLLSSTHSWFWWCLHSKLPRTYIKRNWNNRNKYPGLSFDKNWFEEFVNEKVIQIIYLYALSLNLIFGRTIFAREFLILIHFGQYIMIQVNDNSVTSSENKWENDFEWKKITDKLNNPFSGKNW